MIRVFPRVEDTKVMALFRKGVEGQWSAAQIEWETPLLLNVQEQRALAHVLTPVYLGEQTAMLGASSVLPQFFAAQQTEAQLYLATFLLDEARHFAILTQFYQQMDQRPLEIRDLKEIFRYQARLFKSRDRIEWLWGILLSDIFARQFYHTLAKLHSGSLFAHIANRIQIDEARHLAFAELSLRAVLAQNPTLGKRFCTMRDDLLSLMEAMQKALKSQADTIGLDSAQLIVKVASEIEKKARRLHIAEPEPGDES